ncbi:MAG: DUF2384 domain-containing protein [Burkholderiales bacterium]|nr:DUF2384 domain-containing protein [Burkholderiales bacterium]
MPKQWPPQRHGSALFGYRTAVADLFTMSRDSCSAGSTSAIVEAIALPAMELARVLGLSGPDYERRRQDDMFSRAQRRTLVRLLAVIERAQHVLGDRSRALQWLRHPNRALHASAPLALLGSNAGAERVYAVLMRIEAGTFA